MSIQDHDGRVIVRLSTVHEWAFKIGIWAGPLCALWLVATVTSHDKILSVHEFRLNSIDHVKGSASISPTQTTTVSVGQTKEEKDTRKEYLTSAEVAEKLEMPIRTVTDWAKRGRFYPQPFKDGNGAYIFAPSFSIVPQNAATGGILPITFNPNDCQE
jgi:hypothetical protein